MLCIMIVVGDNNDDSIYGKLGKKIVKDCSQGHLFNTSLAAEANSSTLLTLLATLFPWLTKNCLLFCYSKSRKKLKEVYSSRKKIILLHSNKSAEVAATVDTRCEAKLL